MSFSPLLSSPGRPKFVKKNTVSLLQSSSPMKDNVNDGGDHDGKEEEEEWCPLFSTNLPKDFSSNQKMAAVASLLEEEEERVDCDKGNASVAGRVGGGKMTTRMTRRRRARDEPYSSSSVSRRRQRQEADEDEMMVGRDSSSVGEAQLFLNLWKI
mmetsp:Transcript_44875/g.54337  ORF Transcript_44875/g.54337 Transcript_44875/m.54337 type:complete len:155 (+) Transcript_44875:334-798(+)|eukprot:CAMPEP_0172493174 /NCGR_PEP_ID=MMETSP1066-20121228/24535_1 /TAXON_ID=671091 /ORGANISM="Coscinodiscus wailesii, Strain CCMP2513" /LENGTH=154 /DNA_ID=CAMNT_0013263197 /DNA_START=271 /DNA_END=735 /DNA_ORIENTATION=-